MRLATFLGAALLLAALTTSAHAAPCKSPRQLKLQWESNGDKGQVYAVSYGCAVPASCPVQAGTTATRLPLHVTLRTGSNTVFETDVRGCDDSKICASLNSGGCSGGGDAHKTATDMVKLSYLSKGMASLMLRVRGPMKRPAPSTEPYVLDVADAAGYSAQATFSKCRSADRAAGVTLICR